MTKQQIRTEYKNRRMDLDGKERMKLDDLVLIQFQKISFPLQTKTVLTYFPIDHYAEIDTIQFVRYLQFTIPELVVCYPVIDLASGSMVAVEVNEDSEFKVNHYKIPEPVNGQQIHPENLDVVFVPLLAFDNTGFRVGYGKGFYDRFLKKCHPNALFIGFSYFDPVDNIDDKNQFDVPLTHCITPHKLYEF